MYHQLGTVLSTSDLSSLSDIGGLYEQFVRHIEGDIKSKDLVLFTAQVARKQTDKETAVKFMVGIAEKVKEAVDANLLARVEIARLYLSAGKQKECEEIIEKCREIIEKTVGLENSVHSSFYLVALEHAKLDGKPATYYQQALVYLGYTPTNLIPYAERVLLASDVALSAMIGDGIYNFGELVSRLDFLFSSS